MRQDRSKAKYLAAVSTTDYIYIFRLDIFQVVSGNPVASVNMVGERAADFIKEDWGMKSQ